MNLEEWKELNSARLDKRTYQRPIYVRRKNPGDKTPQGVLMSQVEVDNAIKAINRNKNEEMKKANMRNFQNQYGESGYFGYGGKKSRKSKKVKKSRRKSKKQKKSRKSRK